MMDREQALQWCVDNFNAWPTVWIDTENKILDGHTWIKPPLMEEGEVKFLFVNREKKYFIDKQDWLSAKQPAPLTRDQALAWLVENVKVWPKRFEHSSSPEFDLKQIGAAWIKTWEKTDEDTLCKQATVFIGKPPAYGKVGDKLRITKQDWQAAQPAPVSNKPSWDDAPEEAQILVQDDDGLFHFGSYLFAEPSLNGGWTGEGVGRWFSSTQCAPNKNWRDTLEYRPTTKDDEEVATESHTSIPREFEKVEIPEATKSEMIVCIIDELGDNLNRIKEITDSHEVMRLKIECEEIELAELKKRVSQVLNYYKFNA